MQREIEAGAEQKEAAKIGEVAAPAAKAPAAKK